MASSTSGRILSSFSIIAGKKRTFAETENKDPNIKKEESKKPSTEPEPKALFKSKDKSPTKRPLPSPPISAPRDDDSGTPVGVFAWDLDQTLFDYKKTYDEFLKTGNQVVYILHRVRIRAILKKSLELNYMNIIVTARNKSENQNHWLSLTGVLTHLEEFPGELFHLAYFTNGNLKSPTLDVVASKLKMDRSKIKMIDDMDFNTTDCAAAGYRTLLVNSDPNTPLHLDELEEELSCSPEKKLRLA